MKNKVVVITGASSGLGLSLVKIFLEGGNTVYGLSKSKMGEDITNPSFTHIMCDVRDSASLQKAASSIPQVDILINNAGIILQGEFASYTPVKIKDVIDTDLTGLIYSTLVFLPKIPERQGSFIVNVSSTAGVSDKAGETVYRAAKHGVQGFTDSLRLELGPKNIKVIGFYPGGMKTELFAKSGSSQNLDKNMHPSDIAKTIQYIVEQPDSVSIDTIIINRGVR